MDHHQHSEGGAQAEQDEPLFGPGMIRVVEKEAVFVPEDRSRLLKGDPVFTLIERVFAGIPSELRLRMDECRYDVRTLSTIEDKRPDTIAARERPWGCGADGARRGASQ
jgi:hypothetical protein